MSWAFVAMAAGTLLQGNAQRRVEKKQQALINESDAYKKGKVANANAAIDAYLKRLNPADRDAEKMVVREELTKNLQDTVGAVEKFSAPQVTEGKLSKAFADRVGTNRAANADRIGRTIEQLAIIGTPAQTGMRDATAFGRSALEAGANYDSANRVGAAYENAASKVTARPLEMLIAQGLQGYGIGKMMGGKPGVKPEQLPAPVEDRTFSGLKL